MNTRPTYRRAGLWPLLALAGCLMNPTRVSGQTTPPLSVTDAVQLAVNNYPALKESRARAAAADAGIRVARAAYLPRLDMIWQVNRATHNNVLGLLLPQSVLPPISGPVLGTRSYEGVWGSAGGMLLSWDAIDFGQRKANVEAARAESAAAKAQSELTQLDVAAAAADAFLTVLASDEAVRTAQANVERLKVFADSVRTLVANQLRPGADESRADAELALARNQLSQATQAAEIARASLAAAIGAAGTSVEPLGAPFAGLPEVTSLDALERSSHPAARADATAVEAGRARELAVSRSYLPHVILQSSFAARGSGADASMSAEGSWPQVPNWAAGVSLTFPALDVLTARARRSVEIQNQLAATARYDQTIQNLTAGAERARALMKATAEIAQNTPIARQAAMDAETRARARYQNGLASITEVAEAQRLLAQAEAEDALGRLGVWRALLAASQIRGDLTPFLEQVTRQP